MPHKFKQKPFNKFKQGRAVTANKIRMFHTNIQVLIFKFDFIFLGPWERERERILILGFSN